MTPVEVLMSQLLQRGTTRGRFRLPLSKDDAARVLLAAVKAEVEHRCRTFIMSDTLRNQAIRIADWLTGDSSQFGLLLYGGCGNGKSTFVKAFQQILNQLSITVDESAEYKEKYQIRICDARHLTRLCKDNYSQWHNLCSQRMLAIDDLGTEPLEIMDYGNVYYPTTDMLTMRYDRQLFTIITTNLTPQEIREKYGDRIADRLNEMMVKIVFENPTYRKP